jgi:hypothetical protein
MARIREKKRMAWLGFKIIQRVAKIHDKPHDKNESHNYKEELGNNECLSIGLESG